MQPGQRLGHHRIVSSVSPDRVERAVWWIGYLTPAPNSAPTRSSHCFGTGGMGEVEALCGREASVCEAGSPQPKSRVQRGISP
jgi:hypothetical protein